MSEPVDYRAMLKMHIKRCIDLEGVAFELPGMTDAEQAAWDEINAEIDDEYATMTSNANKAT